VSGAPAEGVMLVGAALNLTASIKDAAGGIIADRAPAWSSSNTAVATVSPIGVVTGISPGRATIKALIDAVFDTAALTVRVGVAPPSPAATAPVVQTVLDGRVTLSIPPGAVPANVTALTVGPAVAPPASTELLSTTAFDFGPSGTQFATPLTLTLKFDSNTVSAADRVGLAIYHVVGAEYQEVSGSVVNTTTNEVSAPIVSFSSYAILRRATPATLAPSAGNNQTATAGNAVPVSPAVRVLDARGRTVRFATVTFAVTSGGGSLTGAVQTSDADGVAAVGSWTLGTLAGANALTATVNGVTPATFTATAVAGAPTRLVITSQPVSTTAGASLGSVVVTAQDALGNRASSFTGSVGVVLGNPGGATLGGTATVAAAGGIATFSGLSVNRPGTGYTLVASSNGLASATTNAFDINAGATVKLVFTQQPQNTGAGASLGTVQVSAEDAADNVTPAYAGTVQVALTPANGTAALSGTLTATAVAGVATFSALSVNRPGTYSLLATATGVPNAASAGFTITLGPAAQLALFGGGGQTASANTTLPQLITVQVTDIAGNTVSGAGRAINFAVASGGGTVSPDAAATNSFGRVSTTWTLGATVGSQSMTASSAGLSGITIAATGTPTPLHLYSDLYYGYWYASFGIGQSRTAYVSRDGATTAAVTVTLSHTGTARTSAPATVTIPAGQYQASFEISGTAAGPDVFTATAPGYAQVSVNSVVDKGRIYLDYSATALVAGDSVLVTLRPLAPDGSPVDGLVTETTFALTSGANVQLVSGGTPSTAITSVTIPAGGGSALFWMRAVSSGTANVTVTNANYQTFNTPVTVFVPGPAARLVLVSGGDQYGFTNTALPQPIVIQVTDAAGVAVVGAGRVVNVVVVTGSGSVLPASASTNAAGRVSIVWTLGTTGAQTINATSTGLTTLTVTATASKASLVLFSDDYYYYYWYSSLGIGQYRTGFVARNGDATGPLTVTLSHIGTAHTSTPATVTIPAGEYRTTFVVAGVSIGTDALVAAAPGYDPAAVSTVVDKGRVYLDYPSSIPVKLTDSVHVYLNATAPDGGNGQLNVVEATTFTLTPNANIQFVSGGVSSTVITSITIPAGANYVDVWIRPVAPGVGSFTITNANYQTISGTVTVSPAQTDRVEPLGAPSLPAILVKSGVSGGTFTHSRMSRGSAVGTPSSAKPAGFHGEASRWTPTETFPARSSSRLASPSADTS
jgi:hypothetical protein